MNIYIEQKISGLSPNEIKADREKLINLCKKHYVGVDDINILDICPNVSPRPNGTKGDLRVYAIGTALLSLYLADVVVFGPDYKSDGDSVIIESVCKKHLMPCLYANNDFSQLLEQCENMDSCSTEKPDEKVLTKADLIKYRKIFNCNNIHQGQAYYITKDDERRDVLVTKVDEHSINVVYLTNGGQSIYDVILIDEVIKGDVKICKSLDDDCLTENDVLKTIPYIDETAVEVGATYLVKFNYGNNYHEFVKKLSEVSCNDPSMLVFGDANNVKCVFANEIATDDAKNFQMRKYSLLSLMNKS